MWRSWNAAGHPGDFNSGGDVQRGTRGGCLVGLRTTLAEVCGRWRPESRTI